MRHILYVIAFFGWVWFFTFIDGTVLDSVFLAMIPMLYLHHLDKEEQVFIEENDGEGE